MSWKLVWYRPSAPKKRFEIYVCTAAERFYAMEAWRILDPNNELIPLELQPRRIVCVPAGKTLVHTFLQTISGCLFQENVDLLTLLRCLHGYQSISIFHLEQDSSKL